MTWMEWYDSLSKPSWTPAPSTISLIWTILYPVILVSFGFVFVQAFRRRVPNVPFAGSAKAAGFNQLAFTFSSLKPPVALPMRFGRCTNSSVPVVSELVVMLKGWPPWKFMRLLSSHP